MEIQPVKAIRIGDRIVLRGDDTSAGKMALICNIGDGVVRKITEKGAQIKKDELESDRDFYEAILRSGIFDD